ncbi:MAG: hypothetical protein KY451_14085, partial [Actinobacteria bacterium]|nr:hypothetical protein [Actinomycetota bacterium]
MIVISGALVLVALVLLVIGVTMPDLDFVYASIVVSLVSLIFLIIGILQRRGSSSAAAAPSERAPVTMSRPAAERAEEQQVTAVSPRPASGGWSKAGDGGRRTATASAAPAVAVKSFPPKAAPPVDEPMDEPMDESDGTVLIVPGRPRYHVEGCRFVAGKSADEVDVLDARDDGFTPCGFCKPDAVLAGQAQLDEEPLELDAQDEDVAPPVPAAATSRRRSTADGTRAVGDQPPLAARAKGALTKVGATTSKLAKVLPTPSASGKDTSDTADHEPSQPVEPAAAASAPARAATSTTGKPLVRKPAAKAVTVDPAPHKPAASEPMLAKPVPVKPSGSRTGTGKPVPAGTAAAAATSTGKPAPARSAPAPTTSPASARAKPMVRKPGAKAVTVDSAPHKPAASEPKLAKPVPVKPPTRSTAAKPAPAE